MDQIILYSMPTCPHCAGLRKYLEEMEVSFRDVNIAIDSDGLKELRQKTGQVGVPVLDVKGKVIIGFNRSRIREALTGAEKA